MVKPLVTKLSPESRKLIEIIQKSSDLDPSAPKAVHAALEFYVREKLGVPA